MIVVPNHKKIEIILRIQVCLISQINIDYRENGGKQSFFFFANRKHQYRVSQCGKHGCSAQSQKELRIFQESKFVSVHG